MLSYELSYRWADPVIKVYQSFSHRVGEQVFVSEFAESLYFLGHRRAVYGRGDEAPPTGWDLFKIGLDGVVAVHGDIGRGGVDVCDGIRTACPVDKPVAS